MSNSNKRLAILAVISMLVYCGKMTAQTDSRYTWKSTSPEACIKRVEITPAQYAVTVVDQTDTVSSRTVITKPDDAIPSKSRFTLANKTGGSNQLRTANQGCSLEITVKNQQSGLQDTKSWSVTINRDAAVIDFSRLPAGVYQVAVKTKDGPQSFQVRYKQ